MTETTDDATARSEDRSTDRSEPRSGDERTETASRTEDRSSTASRRRRSRPPQRLLGESGVVEYVYWGGLVVCSILAVVALFNFYTNATHAISVWVEAKYEPIIQSLFALVVLLAALVGVSLTVRELSPDYPEGSPRAEE